MRHVTGCTKLKQLKAQSLLKISEDTKHAARGISVIVHTGHKKVNVLH
jgi:hypothetical protein